MADKNDDGSVDEVTACPDCKGTHLKRDYDHAEIVCADCGLVLEDNIVDCLLYTSPSPRDYAASRMPSSA